MSTLLNGLNEKQIEAVTATEGPVLILAGAGSGKTKTLIHRIAYLIEEKKVKPWNILAMTFTNKAAREMGQRCGRLLRQPWDPGAAARGIGSATMPALGTFHSICSRLLRAEIGALGFKPGFTIYNAYDSQTLIKSIMSTAGIDTKQVSPYAMAGIISKQKNELVSPETFATAADGAIEQTAARIYSAYVKALKAHQALDFDDLIGKTIELFERFPEILKRYQDRFQYLLVDEYQDTNHAQFRLVSMLSATHGNLCVIGDDYQAIYGFRGADYRNILEFETHFPKTRVMMLEQNYRSTQTIVAAGNAIIAENRHQKTKKLWTQNPSGEKIMVQEVFDEREEGRFIVETLLGLRTPDGRPQRIADGLTYEPIDEPSAGILDRILATTTPSQGRKLRAHGGLAQTISERLQSGNLDLSRFAILYRTNAQSRSLEETLLDYGLPYQIVGGVNFYERKEVKDMLAYMRLIVAPEDGVALQRVINEPARGIGTKTWLDLNAQSERLQLPIVAVIQQAPSLGFTPSVQRGLAQFSQLLHRWQLRLPTSRPVQMIDDVLKDSGYKTMLESEGTQGEERLENIQELKTVAKKYDHLAGSDGVIAFLEEVALVSDLDRLKEATSAVTLMTVHAAKGLEFPVVFLAGMEEGLFPHSNSMFDPKQLEEERRLCYVAVTRAKEQLTLTYTAQRTLYGKSQINAPSRFLDALDESLVAAAQPF